jgi:hypothetical protein
VTPQKSKTLGNADEPHKHKNLHHPTIPEAPYQSQQIRGEKFLEKA